MPNDRSILSCEWKELFAYLTMNFFFFVHSSKFHLLLQSTCLRNDKESNIRLSSYIAVIRICSTTSNALFSPNNIRLLLHYHQIVVKGLQLITD